MQQTHTFLSNIRRIIRYYDSMLKPICGRYGLTLMETTIISFLFHHPDRDTAADIVEIRMLSKSNVSQAVESLIQKSLLQRRQDTRDRRRIHLSLTPAAAPITREIESVRSEFRRRIFRGFTEGEIEQFFQFHQRIAANATAAEGGQDV